MMDRNAKRRHSYQLKNEYLRQISPQDLLNEFRSNHEKDYSEERTMLIKKHLLKTKEGYVDKDNVEMAHMPSVWNEDMVVFKQQRIKALTEQIAHYENVLARLKAEENMSYECMMVEFFLDELNMDLRENQQLLKYDGRIPARIDQKSRNKVSDTYSKWSKRLGHQAFKQLYEDVQTTFRGDIIMTKETTTGGGKA